MKEALIIFAKNPEAGNVKTRLAASIGNEAALSVYQKLLSYTASITKELPIEKIIFYSDHVIQHDIWDNKHFSKQVQAGSDLGERMTNAFADTFQKGYSKSVIIGTDCPELNAGIIIKAFAYLDLYDVVIGPAEDGGYYLVGMKQLHAQVFENINWSTNTVLDETRMRCDALQLNYSLLPVLRDIDTIEDLKYLKTGFNVQHHHPDI
ncbi:MAG: TIGR04282 family arsenosugar biosynthesis glycosyltransferase [Saprospiraceae bacterium]